MPSPERVRVAGFAHALLGFGLALVSALSVVAWRGATGSPATAAGLGEAATALLPRLAALAPRLTALGLLGFAVGLSPAALLRAAPPWPFLGGLGAGAFWLLLAISGTPYSLGLTAPAGVLIVSVFLGVLVSGAAIGSALGKGEIGGG